VCPFVDKAYSRCSVCMTLRNVTQAVAYCANRYSACPIYQELVADDRQSDPVKVPVGLLAAS
jgi:hypothetical protein